MKRFTKIIGKLPLSGKVAIRQLVFGIVQSTTWEVRKRYYIGFMILLTISIPVHGMQLLLGLIALGFNSPIWARIVSVLYALVNLCVILTQAYLGYRMIRFVSRQLYSQVKRNYIDYSFDKSLTMTAITLGCQLIFLLQFFLYHPRF